MALYDKEEVQTTLWRLIHRKENAESKEEMSVKDYDNMRIKFGDQARFIMPILLQIAGSRDESIETRRMASRFFIRGGTRQSIVGANLSEVKKPIIVKCLSIINCWKILCLPPKTALKRFKKKSASWDLVPGE